MKRQLFTPAGSSTGYKAGISHQEFFKQTLLLGASLQTVTYAALLLPELPSLLRAWPDLPAASPPTADSLDNPETHSALLASVNVWDGERGDKPLS